jgi:pSer/pThr/pTyr-binding forkhead associated (FHA) protein
VPEPNKNDADRLLDSFEEFEADVPTLPPAASGSPPAKPRAVRTPTVKEKIVRPAAAQPITPTLPAPPPPGAATLPAPPTAKPRPAEAAEPEAPAYRPVRRPPMALLCVVDDGRDDGEWVRLRTDVTVIGRASGDVVIPHDDLMSGRHAEVRRVNEDGKFRFELADLGSTNGTFVKVHKVGLRHGQELQLGRSRFRFETPPPQDAPVAPTEAPKGVTVSWHSLSAGAVAAPVLVEVTPHGDGRRFALAQPENWLGRDAACAVPLPDDALLAKRHAKVFRDAAGVWHLEGAGRDGVWLRVERAPVEKTCAFQLGEQRFVLRVP